VRIAVIADTHDRLPDHVLADVLTADEIWHLGDVVSPETLKPLEQSGKPLRVVRGNNDWCRDWPEEITLDCGGIRFRLIHIEPRRPAECDVILHGHTHIPRDEVVNGVRILNPGTIGKPNKGAPPTYAWLDVDPATGSLEWTVVPVR